MKITPAKAMMIFIGLCIVALLFGAYGLAQAAEVSSIRDSRYEWQCEDANGTLISGHTRQDKAFQSCINRSLETGETFYVRGGTFRVTATGLTDPTPTPTPDPDPVPDPDPPPDPPPSGAMVSFGPVTAPVQYPASISALQQDRFRWEIVFTLNSLPIGSDGAMGLASRDQHGQVEKGHLSVWVTGGGAVRVRHQDIAGGAPSIQLDSSTIVVPGTEYKITVSISVDDGFGLFVNGVLEASSPLAFGLASNNLPLVVGGLCSLCTVDGTVGPNRPVDGSVFMEIWDDPLSIPTPTASTQLTWTNPTERADNTLLDPGELTAIAAYQVSPGRRILLASVAPDVSGYEVTGLYAGTEYCFVATAISIHGASEDSNIRCKVP